MTEQTAPVAYDRNDTIYGGYVLTQTGRFYLDCSTPETIKLSDIAISLSRTGRWSNLGQRALSVGEHTLYVSKLAERIAVFDKHSDEVQLLCAFHGLHHDDHEAYPPGELPTPCKKLLNGVGPMGDLIQKSIYDHFGWEEPYELIHNIVKEADNIAAYKEALVTFPNHPDAKNIGLRPRHPSFDLQVPSHEPVRRDVMTEWLTRHRQLESWLGLKAAI